MEPFIISSPLVVDPDDPSVLPPVIVSATTWCPESWPEAQVEFVVQNVDLYHYPPPFQAVYSWTYGDGDNDLTGKRWLAGGESDDVHVSTSLVGTFTFTVTNDDLGGTASAEVDVPDCVNDPGPSADPLPPLVVVPVVACAEDFTPDSGTATITFFIFNQPGDDGSTRTYDFGVTWIESQLLVDHGPLGGVDDSDWIAYDVMSLHSGTYMVSVTDHVDAALTASVSVDVPPCEPDVPPAESVPPLAAPQIISVTTKCADPVLLDGAANFVVHNANYLFLGGTGDLFYDWTLSSTSSVVESAIGNYFNTSGLFQLVKEPLAPDTYTATISVTDYPAMSDTVTFTIDDCSVSPPFVPPPLDVYGLSTFCIPGDDSETLFFVVDILIGDSIGWAVMDGQDQVAWKSQVYLDGSLAHPVSVRYVPAGSYDLVVTNYPPSISVSTPIQIGSCMTEIEPTDPVDPSTTTDPGEPTPTTTIGDVGPTTTTTVPAVPGSGPEPVDTGDAVGTLPATGSAVGPTVAVALFAAVAGGAMLALSRRRSDQESAGAGRRDT